MDLFSVFNFVGKEHHCTNVFILDISTNASTCALHNLKSDSLEVHQVKVFNDSPLGFLGSSEIKGFTTTLQ